MVMKRINKNKNFWVIAYDVADDLRRSRIAKEIEKLGVRVNYSVFECLITDAQFEKLQNKLSKLLCNSEDSIIYYPLCINCYSKIVYMPDRNSKPLIVSVV